MVRFIEQLLLILAVAPFALPEELFPYFHDIQPDLLSSERFYYFDMELLKEIALAEPEGNFLISPLSIKTTLAMILEGAVNDSARELRDALRVGKDKNNMREQFQKLLKDLQADPTKGVTLKNANQVFMIGNIYPRDDYVQTLGKYYNSNAIKIPSQPPQDASTEINNWVASATEGLIPTIIEPESISGRDQVLLASAVYFNGIWEKAFDATKTVAKCFKTPKNSCYMTPMMDIIGDFKYDNVDELNAKVLELPYKGGEFSMIIVLPNEENGIQLLARDIRKSINKIVDNINETEVMVTLPRFSISYTTDLVEHLRKLHINAIFGPKAALTGIAANVGVSISNVVHKATIEVNEKGSIAAAATGAVVIALMGNSMPRFRADHPFLFFIRHKATGTILFEGRVNEPELATETNIQQKKPKPTPRFGAPTEEVSFAVQQNQRQPLEQNQPQPLAQGQSESYPQDQRTYTPEGTLKQQGQLFPHNDQNRLPLGVSVQYQQASQQSHAQPPIYVSGPQSNFKQEHNSHYMQASFTYTPVSYTPNVTMT